MRRGWILTVPLALAGVESAHVLANLFFGSPEGSREIFASEETGAEFVPLVVAVGAALVLVGLASRVAGRLGLPRSSRSLAVPFACLPPLAFVALELTEGVLNDGSVPWADALEPTFLVGLVLQLPFALAGYVLARMLLRLTDCVRALFVRRRTPWVAAARRIGRPRVDGVVPGAPRGPANYGRAPPDVVLRSG